MAAVTRGRDRNTEDLALRERVTPDDYLSITYLKNMK